ncbi:MAG TPA: glycine--tRNA ligase subunit alpha [bacterium]|uniref:Glycine--tRNA ligase alpha subunit n=1 Tax=candidate division TA06 bacterium ADurb.Bin417 TaxID=1852828 RepID=A0A1V5MGS6_UNCT6|nr:MAG: Glycine--tRNA ligase alpha subunit [candidate division TA06 bacterium ADurb.Bin417]HNQ35065.1 glycine--tRNA ligase subunit alpha [bacterium]HNS48434.1 glycine--tRNA ligase subunit alpha [bacterium]
MDFQTLLAQLLDFWRQQGCLVYHPTGLEVGAGTMNPATFFKVLGPEPWRTAYLEPSRRPADGRYGENPTRLYQHYQLQVILKPSPAQTKRLYLESLQAIGISWRKHDIRFIDDNWESPTLGAWGVGWEVWLDGLEITQFTYLQQAGGLELKPISVELTYGLERLACFLQKKRVIYDLDWSADWNYGQLRHRAEAEYSRYSFEAADIDRHFELFNHYEQEASQLIKRQLVWPAYDYVLKCSHTFNTLESRGAISLSERQRFIGRVRKLASACARLYLGDIINN